jgi:vacuolar-type H+-ATPase subunit E/Vma4
MSSKTVELEANLIERVLRRREEIISEAEKRAKEIIEEARERVRKILVEGRETQLRLAGTDLKAVRDKILGEAEQEGRRKLMEARKEAISRVFSDVENRLRTIAEGRDKSVDYHKVLLKLISEAASAIGERELVIAMNKRDIEYLMKELGRIESAISKALGYEVRLTVEEEPINCLGGVILYDRSKRKIFYNTLDGRILKVRKGMEAEVAKVLGVI